MLAVTVECSSQFTSSVSPARTNKVDVATGGIVIVLCPCSPAASSMAVSAISTVTGRESDTDASRLTWNTMPSPSDTSVVSPTMPITGLDLVMVIA